MRPGVLAPAVLLLVLALAGPAQAQAACSVAAALDRASALLQPGQAAQFNLTVSDTSQLPGEARVGVSAPSGGWQANVTPARARVAAGGTAVFAVVVVAPRNATLPVLNLAFDVQLACQDPVLGTPVGSPATPDRPVVLNVSVAAPPGAPLAPPAGQDAVLLGALLVLAALVTAAALLLRRRAGLSLASPEPHRDLPPGGGASFPVHVRNGAQRAARVELRTGEVPEGWRVLLPPGALDLGPGEARTVQVVVRAPPAAQPPAAAEVALEARADGDASRPARLTLRAFVVSPDALAAAERPDVVVRDEGS